MRKHLLTVLKYFGYFSYAPSIDEILIFFPRKITKKALHLALKKEVQAKKLKQIPIFSIDKGFSLLDGSINYHKKNTNSLLYTLPQYSIVLQKFSGSQDIIRNEKLVVTIQKYIWILKRLPLVRFVGVTGKSAMRGLRENDDLDLCVVTKANRLWTTRFFVVILAKILGIHGMIGVCLNLFFDEGNLLIAKRKQNSYIAHELLQMKPIIDKDAIYERFVHTNGWIYRYFPNAVHATLTLTKIRPNIPNSKNVTIDHLFRMLQLPLILHNHTAFHITSTQLWLFKNDFEKKLKRAGLVL